MRPLDDARLRACLVNASLSERKSLVLPDDLAGRDWSSLDFLGWRDRRAPLVGCVVADIDGEPVGVLLREAETRTRSRPQCSWCSDVELPNHVVLFTARRAGAAGRRGDGIGTLVCARFECSANVRRRPARSFAGFDPELARTERITALRAHVDAFVREVAGR
jgi:hypothetical protein